MTVISRGTFDTNILIYSIDLRDQMKHQVAERVVAACSDAGAIITLQALSEFFRAVTRKRLLASSDAANIITIARNALNVVPSAESDLVHR